MRDIITVVCAAVLSFVLLAGSIVAVGQFTQGGRLEADSTAITANYGSVKATYGDPWQSMLQTARLYDYGVLPAIALIEGGLVGLFAKRRETVLGSLAVLPLVVFVLAAKSFTVKAFLITCAYVLLASIGAGALRLLKNRRAVIPTTS